MLDLESSGPEIREHQKSERQNVVLVGQLLAVQPGVSYYLWALSLASCIIMELE